MTTSTTTAAAALLVIGLIMMILLLLVQQQQEAYAQAVTFDEIDEDHQPLVEEILNALQNQTVDEIRINEGGQMVIEYQDAVLPQPPIPPSPYSPPTRPSILNNADSVNPFNPGNISIVMPHNFTAENGYEYRDGTIYKPDGTKLFGSN